MTTKAVIVFSGGQDSTTCLIHALQTYDEIHCITFDYGQRHRAEIDVARELAKRLGVVVHTVLETSMVSQLSVSSLTHNSNPISKSTGNGIPDTFVPGRNILFLTLASIYAYQVGAEAVITGVSETESSGYPDCGVEFIEMLNTAVQLGLGYSVRIETPLMRLNKAETWALADHYNQLDLIRYHTLTCYNGIKGSGCGDCDACALRAKGLGEFLARPTEVYNNLKTKLHV